MADQVLDCKGLSCPMPIVKISKAMKVLAAGQTLEVLATDPAFKADVEAWVRKTGNVLQNLEGGGNLFKAVLQKS